MCVAVACPARTRSASAGHVLLTHVAGVRSFWVPRCGPAHILDTFALSRRHTPCPRHGNASGRATRCASVRPRAAACMSRATWPFPPPLLPPTRLPVLPNRLAPLVPARYHVLRVPNWEDQSRRAPSLPPARPHPFRSGPLPSRPVFLSSSLPEPRHAVAGLPGQALAGHRRSQRAPRARHTAGARRPHPNPCTSPSRPLQVPIGRRARPRRAPVTGPPPASPFRRRGPNCFDLVLSTEIFVNQGPLSNLEKILRGPPANVLLGF
jgi:hypothetical protein